MCIFLVLHFTHCTHLFKKKKINLSIHAALSVPRIDPLCARCMLFFTCLTNSYAEQENSDISYRKRREVGGGPSNMSPAM